MTIKTMPATAQSGAAVIATDSIAAMRPALEQLAASADAVMGALEDPPAMGSKQEGIPAGLDALPIESRIRYLGGLVTLRAPGQDAERQKARRDIIISVERAERDLADWMVGVRDAAEREALTDRRSNDERMLEMAEAHRLSALPPAALAADASRAVREGRARDALVLVLAGKLAGGNPMLNSAEADAQRMLDKSDPGRVAARELVAAAQREHYAARERLARIARAANALAAVSPSLERRPDMAPHEMSWPEARALVDAGSVRR